MEVESEVSKKGAGYLLTSAFFDFLETFLFKSNTLTSHNSLISQAVMKLLSLVGGEGSSRTLLLLNVLSQVGGESWNRT